MKTHHKQHNTHWRKNLLNNSVAVLAMATGLTGIVNAEEAEERSMIVLDEIMVTAQKRQENAQDIGISVSAFGSEDFRYFGNDIGSLAGQSPGVESYANGSFLQSFFIRGIGLNEFASNYNAPVAIHNDEVYVARNWQAARPVFDVARVEILKGPQGTTFGRNNTGGAVNYYYNEPTSETEGYIRGDADEHERYSLNGAVGGALSENLTGRIAFQTRFGSGGPQFNIFDGEEHGTPRLFQIRGRLNYEIGDTVIKIMVQGGSDKSDLMAYKGPGIFNVAGPGFCPEVLTGAVSFAPDTCSKFNGLLQLNGVENADLLDTEPGDIFTINQNYPGKKDDTFYGGYLRIEHDFENMTLTSITSYDRYNRDQREDSDGSPLVSNDLDVYSEFDQFTQELRLNGQFAEGRSNFVLGLFYEHDQQFQADSLALGVGTPFNLPPASAGLPPRLYGEYLQKVNSFAVFLNNDYDVTDRLTISTGLRYTYERTVADGFSNAGLNDVLGDTDTPQTFLVPGNIDTLNEDTSAANPTLDGATSNRHVDENVSWKLGINYDVQDDVMLYATASTGFRTGGYSIPFGGAIVEYEREKVLSFEVGLKSRFMDDRVQLNMAGFRLRTTDAQVNVDDPVSPVVPITRNIPEVVTWGFEADLKIAATEHLTANFGVSYLDAELTDAGGRSMTTISTLGPIPLQGNTPVNSPKWQLNGRLNYLRPVTDTLGILASADARWVDSRFLELTNQPVDFAPSYIVVNGRIGVASLDGSWDVALYAKNLFNEEYLTYMNNLPGPGFKLDIFGEKRSIGIEFGYYF